MSKTIRVGLSQINTCVGALESNVSKIIEYIDAAKAQGADIVCFPELAVTGYPPEDLLLKPSFIEDNIKALQRVKEASGSITVIVGFVDKQEDIYNAAAVIHNGEIVDVYHKRYLPNYSVFDENRYFQCGMRSPVYRLNGTLFGVNICEDVWYPGDPIREQAVLGNAEIIFNISSSPYYVSKVAARERMLCTRARDNSTFMVFTNLVGGQDELIFDGQSMAVSPDGKVLACGNSFEEEMIFADLDILRPKSARTGSAPGSPANVKTFRIRASAANIKKRPPLPTHHLRHKSETEEIYAGLVMGVRDYLGKNGFQKAAVGLSGGIDSSLTAALAVDALGPENVIGVLMPSPFSSRGSVKDSRKLAENLGIRTLTLPIEKLMIAYEETLAEAFQGTSSGIAEENLQARIRGNLLMALSNKFGWLVLTTGNKSEISVGYCTLYGDMAGGFSVIKDVPKTLVYLLANHVNDTHGKKIIPQPVIDKEPSAELRPDQKDIDSLLHYPLLDSILEAYVEEDKGADQLRKLGFAKRNIEKVTRMVDQNEYKRRQGAPGIKITPKAFGKDRRLPITNHYRHTGK
ncbi:MAG: NAD+ synthase [Candidatus Dadabacteria bacterium]|nr:NAD+ synthase [Candidatus Dadabacteria bacterium]